MEKIKQLGKYAKSFLVGLSLLFILIIALVLFESFVGTNLLETKFYEFKFRYILYFIFFVIASFYGYSYYKMSNKDKSSCTISWLVGLSLQFILIIVIGLFADTFSGFSVTVSTICIFNGSTITLTSVLLFILSILISILSGNVVYQKGKENRQKQQKMGERIRNQEYFLNILYKKLENREENQ